MEYKFRHLLVIQLVAAFAGMSAGIFGIVYLAKEGLGPGQGFSFAEASLFYMVGFLSAAIFCVLMNVRSKIRLRNAMAIGLIAYALTFAGLAFLKGYILVTLIPIFYGISVPLFYLPFNALVIKKTTQTNRGMRIGLVFLSVTLMGVLGPTVAGLVINSVGFISLFLFAIALIVADVVFILVVIDGGQELSFKFNFSGFGRRNAAALYFEGCFEGLFYALIPLITLLFITGEQELGFIFSIFQLAGGTMTVILGVMSDRIRKRHLFMWAGAVVSSIFAIIVSLAPDLGTYLVGNSLLQLTAIVAPLFIFAMVSDMQEDAPGSVASTREVLLNSGRASSLALFFIASMAGVGIQAFFGVSSVFLLLMLVGRGNESTDREGVSK